MPNAGNERDGRWLAARRQRDDWGWLRLRPLPLGVDQQLVGLGGDLLGLAQDVLDRLVVGIPGNQLAGQGHHQVVAGVAVGVPKAEQTTHMVMRGRMPNQAASSPVLDGFRSLPEPAAP